MSNYSSLKSAIDANIKANGRREITGPVLNAILNAVVNSLGDGYLFRGVAIPSTNPGTPDQNVAYLAITEGTYTHMGGLSVTDGELSVFSYNGAWSKIPLALVPTKTSQLDNDLRFVTSEEMGESLSSKQDTIQDLSEIRSGAALGATAYQKPSSGIPSSDMTDTVQQAISFAESTEKRSYNSSNPDGMGYLVLKKNKTFAEQVTEANTIYEIRHDFDLAGNVSIPQNCVLHFVGGSIGGDYTLTGNYTRIDADDYAHIFKNNISFDGSFANNRISICWFGASPSPINGPYIDCSSNIQKALDAFPKYGFGEVYVPCGLFYISASLMLEQYKSLYLEGCSSLANLEELVGKDKKEVLSTGTIFSDQDIDFLVVDLNNSGVGTIANYYLGIAIVGGCFDTSLVSNFSHAVIKFTDATNQKTAIHQLKIRTTILNKGRSADASGYGIQFDFNRATCFNTHINSYIDGYNYGIIDTSTGAFTDVFINDFVDDSRINCAHSVSLSHTQRGQLNGAYQSRVCLPQNNEDALIYLDCSEIIVSGSVWDTNINSGGLASVKYGLELTAKAADTIITGRAKSLLMGQIKGEGYAGTTDSFYDLTKGLRYARNFGYLNNVLFDDGEFSYSYELASGMTASRMDTLFLSKSEQKNAVVFLGEASESDAYLKITIDFPTALYAMNCIGVAFIPASSYYCIFNKIKFTITSLSDTIYEEQLDGLSGRKNDGIQRVFTTLNGVTTNLIKKVEILFTEWDSQFIIQGQTPRFGLQDVFASAFSAVKKFSTKFLTTDGKGFRKIYGAGDVLMEDYTLPHSGNSFPQPSLVGFDYFKTDYVRPFFWAGNRFVDGDGYTASLRHGITSRRPIGYGVQGGTLMRDYDYGYCYFDTNLLKPIYATYISPSDGTVIWSEADGAQAGALRTGTFAQRPTTRIPIGFHYFCTDRHSAEAGADSPGLDIIFVGGGVWVDALGRVVS